MNANSADDTRIVTELENRVMRALQTKDLETIKSLTAEDFIYRGADGTETNRDAFVASIAEIPGELTSVESEGMRAYAYGDTVVMAGLQRSGLKMTDGTEATDAVYFTDVWQRRDGQWKMVFAFSSPAAPTEGQPAGAAPAPAPQQ